MKTYKFWLVILLIFAPLLISVQQHELEAAPILNANGRSVTVLHYYEQTTGTSDVEILAAPGAGLYYIVHWYKISCSADSNVTWKSASTAIDRTQLTGDGLIAHCWPVGCFQTAANEILNFNSSASATCDVTIAYELAN